MCQSWWKRKEQAMKGLYWYRRHVKVTLILTLTLALVFWAGRNSIKSRRYALAYRSPAPPSHITEFLSMRSAQMSERE